MNDNIPHYDFVNMMDDCGNNPLVRVAARGLDREVANRIYWFILFERSMESFEAEYRRSLFQVVS